MSSVYVNYPERDSDGKLVNLGGPPDSITCDMSYEFSIRVFEERTECRSADYGSLYRQAEEAAARRFGTTFCRPARCGPTELKQIARRWGCGYQDDRRVAFVDLRFRIDCPPRRGTKALPPAKAESFDPDTFDPRREGDLYAEPRGVNDSDFDKGDEYVQLNLDSFKKLACPAGARLSNFVYKEPVESCSHRARDEEYFKRARQAAKLEVLMRDECGPDCRAVWGFAQPSGIRCELDVVIVVLRVAVVCI